MTMIERVARALCVERGQDPDYSPPDCTPNWLEHVSDARAAIEAMREPTDGMVDVCDEIDNGNCEGIAVGSTGRDVWHAMIRAALDGRPET